MGLLYLFFVLVVALQATCHLFALLKQYYCDRLFHNNEEVEMVVREWLRMQEPELYRLLFLHLCQDKTKHRCPPGMC